MKNLTAKLFVQFFKIGAFTFGGGYAMIPLIQSEVVDKNKWIITTSSVFRIFTQWRRWT